MNESGPQFYYILHSVVDVSVRCFLSALCLALRSLSMHFVPMKLSCLFKIQCISSIIKKMNHTIPWRLT